MKWAEIQSIWHLQNGESCGFNLCEQLRIAGYFNIKSRQMHIYKAICVVKIVVWESWVWVRNTSCVKAFHMGSTIKLPSQRE